MAAAPKAAAAAAAGAVKLHGYFASPTSFLARIGLNVKKVPFEYVPLDLEHDNRAHKGDGLMPVLEHGAQRVTQTGAIFNYINETWPAPPLLPPDAQGRARVRSLATFVSCEIQPFGFYRVDRYLREQLGAGEEAVRAWHRHWLGEGFQALEVMLGEKGTGRLCHGDSPTMADLFLIPQVHRSQHSSVGLNLGDYPRVKRVYENALKDDDFARALPENQPDAKLHAPWQ